jgi:hypothetical protein
MLNLSSERKSLLVVIRRRLHELQLLMSARGLSDPSLDLVAEHRDLVRERNRVLALNGGAR